MSTLPGCNVSLVDMEGAYVVLADHYETLKDHLDHGDKGWVELTAVHGGKLLCRLEDITDVFLATPEHCRNMDAWTKQQQEEAINGD